MSSDYKLPSENKILLNVASIKNKIGNITFDFVLTRNRIMNN